MTLDQAIAIFRKETEDFVPEIVYRFYFNQWVPYASTAEVLATIPIELRWPYMTVNVAGVEYWFMNDLTTLTKKWEDIAIAAASIGLDKLVNFDEHTFPFRKSEGSGPLEVTTLAELKTLLGIISATDFSTELFKKIDKADGYSLIDILLIPKIHDKFAPDEAAVIQGILDFINNLVLTDNNYTDEDKAKLGRLKENPYVISLSAATNVPLRISGGYTVPEGWTVAASGDTNLVITHTMAGRELTSVMVKEIDGTKKRMCTPFDEAYSGISEDGLSITIEGLNPSALPLSIHLFFS